MPLEHLDLLIEQVDEPNLLAHQMDGPDASTTRGLGLGGHLVVDVAAGQHGLVLRGPGTRFEPALNSLLAVAEDLGVFSAHSKCPFGMNC